MQMLEIYNRPVNGTICKLATKIQHLNSISPIPDMSIGIRADSGLQAVSPQVIQLQIW